MNISVSQLFPGIESGLNRIGVLFGAGTSREAGYPLMPDLTKFVIDNMGAAHKASLDKILISKGVDYDSSRGEPNIELLSDLVIEYALDTGDAKYLDLEGEIRRLIVDNILSVKNPDLTNHIRFIKALKRRAHGNPAVVTLITTA